MLALLAVTVSAQFASDTDSASDSASDSAPPSPPVFVVLEGPCHAGNDAEGQACFCSSNYAQECDVRVEAHYGSSEECVITYDADNFDTDDQGEGRFLYAHQMDISLSFWRHDNGMTTVSAKYKSDPGYGNSLTEDKLWTGNLPLGFPPIDYHRIHLGEDAILRMGEDLIYLDSVAGFNEGFHAIDVAGTNAIAFWSSIISHPDERGGRNLLHDQAIPTKIRQCAGTTGGFRGRPEGCRSTAGQLCAASSVHPHGHRGHITGDAEHNWCRRERSRADVDGGGAGCRRERRRGARRRRAHQTGPGRLVDGGHERGAARGAAGPAEEAARRRCAHAAGV